MKMGDLVASQNADYFQLKKFSLNELFLVS